LHENAQLLLAQAWVLSVCCRREAAAAAIAAFERLSPLDAGPLPDGFSSLEASLATLRGTIAWGDFGTALENARRAAELEGPASPWRSVVCLALGCCLYANGRYDQADGWLAQSTEPALAREQWRVAMLSLAMRSLVAGELGQVEQQAPLAARAAKLAQEHGLEEVEGLVFVALGASFEARGRLEEALSALERGATILRLQGHPADLAEALIRLAALLQAIDRHEAAESVLEEARAATDSCPDPRMLGERLAAVERARRTRRRNGKAVLSQRELVILRMLTGPLSERDIGRELYLSHNTIHSHTRSIYRKLGVSSRPEAVAHARGAGLI
jgi:LuxR family maltose regulon positive regulatory protein